MIYKRIMKYTTCIRKYDQTSITLNQVMSDLGVAPWILQVAHTDSRGGPHFYIALCHV